MKLRTTDKPVAGSVKLETASTQATEHCSALSAGAGEGTNEHVLAGTVSQSVTQSPPARMERSEASNDCVDPPSPVPLVGSHIARTQESVLSPIRRLSTHPTQRETSAYFPCFPCPCSPFAAPPPLSPPSSG
jgi:hypothetical protein